MNYIVNNKGGRKLCHEGYMYTVKAITSTSTRWECSQRASLKCKGILRVDIDDDDHILSQTGHNHIGDAASVKAATVMQKIKAELTQTAAAGGSTQQVVCNNLATVTPEVRQAFGSINSLKRSFNRYVAQGRPDNPATLAQLQIAGVWANDIDGNIFLIHDNHSAQNRIIVFGSDNCVLHLAQSPMWYMDGTFKVVPTLFRQLYVIRAPLDESAITCIYAFMASKTEESYMELFQIINDKCIALGTNLDPTTVMLDFEKAMMNAILRFFGAHVEVKACFFHLCQSSWRKIQELGLSQEYINDDDIKLFCGMLDGLAFLPGNLVSAGMQYLKANTPNRFDALVQYFDQTYVSGTFRQIQRPGQNIVVRNTPALFQPAIWNVNDATLADGARTNNICESWNNSFNGLVGYKNATIWACIEGLKKDSMMACLALANSGIGVALKKRVHKKTADLQLRLKNLCTELQNGNVTQVAFMRGIGHNIRYKL